VFHKPFEGIYAKFMALMHLGTNELIRFWQSIRILWKFCGYGYYSVVIPQEW